LVRLAISSSDSAKSVTARFSARWLQAVAGQPHGAVPDSPHFLVREAVTVTVDGLIVEILSEVV
jgi:hypothetical protein